MHTLKPRRIEPTTVPLHRGAVDAVMPAIAAALDGGPAVLPLPESPEALRTSMMDALRPDLPLDDDAAVIVPTSGSTGRPKGVLLPAGAIRASAERTHTRLGGPGSWLLALPATHVAGLMVLARSVVAGTTPVAVDLSEGFDPETFAAAAVRLLGQSSSRRYTSLVPKQLAEVLKTGECALEALAAFDAVLIGGSATPHELIDEARGAGVNVITTYGMTETCGGCVYNGVPLDDVSIEIGRDGRIRIAGPTLASGYRLDPDLTRESFMHGWFVTCDAGSFDDDKRLVVTGRVDDVAITGGVNVPLSAVDRALADLPGIAEACAVALPDAEWGERIVAVVVADEPPSLDEVKAHVTRILPAAYAPKELVVVDSLPRLPGDKLDRRTLTERMLAEHHR